MSTASATVQGFLPSVHGFHFANSWPHEPTLTIPFPTGPLNIGDAAGGLCGGMAFAVRDFFEEGRPIPATDENPPLHSPLYDYLTRRLFDSFDIPAGVARFYAWQLPTHHNQREMAGEQWPVIRAAIDSGRLVCLGLVRVRSFLPTDLGKNHQVLAFGYETDGAHATLHLYDCNHPDDDDVTFTFATDVASGEAASYAVDGAVDPDERTYGAFVQRYTHCSPGAALDAVPVPEMPPTRGGHGPVPQ